MQRIDGAIAAPRRKPECGTRGPFLAIPFDYEGVPTVVYVRRQNWDGRYALPYLDRRWRVVNVEYRLADSARAPAAARDVLCAMRWLAKYADALEIDLERLVVSGISARGAMALIAGTMPASSSSLLIAERTEWSLARFLCLP
ncbi:MAG TPA: alpha/beta hydrolase fold domain-containing protein [Kofleriaceae bacterium]|nr:alpha/beta hydrolase fold domain-containing protein [Kofleriaceae bacterium]